MGIQLPQASPSGATKRCPLSYGEERSLDRQINDLENQSEGSEIVQGLSHQVRDKQLVQKRIAELKRIRETRCVRRAVGREADEITREVEALTTKLQKGMPSWETYAFTRRREGMRYIRLRDWIIKSEMDQTRRNMIIRWKYLKRRLDPDDPHAASIINLFPEK